MEDKINDKTKLENSAACGLSTAPCYMEKTMVCKTKHIGRGPNDKYAFIYLGNVYLPKELVGQDIKLTIKAEPAI